MTETNDLVEELVEYVRGANGLRHVALFAGMKGIEKLEFEEIGVNGGPSFYWLAHKLANNMEFTPRERRFLIYTLLNSSSLKPTSSRRGRPPKSHDLMALYLVEFCRGRGIKVFRNETQEKNECAIDLVSIAFEKLGFGPTSYSGVKNAYLKAKRRFPELVAEH